MKMWNAGLLLSRRSLGASPYFLYSRSCSSQGGPPDPAVMEEAALKIHKEVTRFFVQGPSSDWLRKDLVFENRSSGKVIVGGIQYYRSLLLLKVWGNIRFPFIITRIKQSQTNLEDGTVTIHFEVKGMTQFALLALYFPKQLWYPSHMIKYSKIWKEGISVFHVDKDGKLYRHIFDDKIPTSKISSISSIKESIQAKIKGQVQPQLLSKCGDGESKNQGQMSF